MKFVEAKRQDGQIGIDLQALGKGDVCYVRQYVVKDEPVWVVHAADGTAITMQKDPEAARQTAGQQELDIVSVH